MEMNIQYDATILFVDDESAILDVLRRSLAKFAARVFISDKPQEAIQIARHNQIEVLVTDLKMPGMGGIELLKEVKLTNPNVVSIFLTAYGEKPVVQSAMRLGAYDFVDKPFVHKLMVACVRGALEKACNERINRQIMELFISHYSKLDMQKFYELPYFERERVIKAALGVASMKIATQHLHKKAG